MSELDLAHGCLAREVTFAIETGAASTFGEAVALGFGKEMNRKAESGRTAGHCDSCVENAHLAHTEASKVDGLAGRVSELEGDLDSALAEYVIFEERTAALRGAMLSLTGDTYQPTLVIVADAIAVDDEWVKKLTPKKEG